VRAALVAVAGATGALARYGIGLAVGVRDFPWATLGINLLGSLLLGLVLTTAAARSWSATATVPIAVGFLGAFTTFSTFSHETFVLLRTDRAASAALYVALSLLLGVGAAAVGYWVGRALG
jgi:fluoride exporter